MSWIVKLLIYIASVVILNLFFNEIIISIFVALIMDSIILYIHNVKSKNKNQEEPSIEFKECKHCRSEIDFEATVCPVCRKAQSNANNPIWLVPIFVIIGLFLYCLLSPNAPETAREIFCATGLRKGYPYCYKIDTDKLNDLINRYRY